jgi:lipopolysaccharide/colanic/teichoic acid biosynthesis glycosyltransferase
MTWTVIERKGVKPYKPRYQAIKRLVELLFCLITAPIMIPMGAMIALAIRLDSSGPILFVQERIGKGGRVFRIYKFRTMYHNIDDSGHKAFMKAFVNGNLSGDAGSQKTFKPFAKNQVTRVGRLLRKTSLDELPQLINVLKGDMSFVGPRPNVPWEVEAYHGWHTERLEILPGITGLAQIRGRSNITFDQIVQYDVEYIKNQSLSLDIKILWWTVTSVLFGHGAE